MKRVATAASLLLVINLAALQREGPPDTRPRFEVASLKRSDPKAPPGAGAHDHCLTLPNVTLRACLLLAYQVQEFQLRTPAWFSEDRYDIVAAVPPGTPDKEVWVMMQTLLEERFKLVMHWEKRQSSVYALTVSNSGLKVNPVSDCSGRLRFAPHHIIAKCTSMAGLAPDETC